MAKHKSGELHCPATALIVFFLCIPILSKLLTNAIVPMIFAFQGKLLILNVLKITEIYEPPHGKTNNLHM